MSLRYSFTFFSLPFPIIYCRPNDAEACCEFQGSRACAWAPRGSPVFLEVSSEILNYTLNTQLEPAQRFTAAYPRCNGPCRERYSGTCSCRRGAQQPEPSSCTSTLSDQLHIFIQRRFFSFLFFWDPGLQWSSFIVQKASRFSPVFAASFWS